MGLLWVDPDHQMFPVLDKDIDADVCIVGAGLSGVGAAFGLMQSGLKVVVLEERTVASGASGRNAGFVLAGPAMVYSEAISAVGPEAARLVWQFTEENNDIIAWLVEELHIDCGYLRRGSMSLGVSESEMAMLEAARRDLDAVGISTCLVPRRRLPRPFDRMYHGGLYYPGNAELNPGAFVRAVARHLEPATVIYERTSVTSIERQADWVIRTSAGTVRCPVAVLATNAYTRRLLPYVPIDPTRGQVAATDPLSRVVVPFPMYANFGYRYWRQTAENRLVVGGWRDQDTMGELGEEERLHDGIQRTLDAFVADVAGDDARVRHRWAGIMGFTPDLLPLVGRVPDLSGLFMAAGYSGHGVAMAFTCGMRVALCAAGGDLNVPDSFDPGRFPKH